jgi:hypothetical protein
MKIQKLTTNEMREIAEKITVENFKTNVLPELNELKYTDEQRKVVFANMFQNAMALLRYFNDMLPLRVKIKKS